MPALVDWLEDIEQLAEELPRLHANLFHQRSEHDFRMDVMQLKTDLPSLDDSMIVVRLMQLIASIGDAHTTLIPPIQHYLPLAFYLFEEGLFVIAAQPEHGDCLGSRVVAIEGVPIEQVMEQVKATLSHENDAFVAAHLPLYLAAADLLYGLAISEAIDAVEITFKQRTGETKSKLLTTVHHHDLNNDWLQLEVHDGTDSVSGKTHLPLYRQGHEFSFWFMVLEPDSIYIQYNACRPLPDYRMPAAFDDLLQPIDSQPDGPLKLVFDLRNNRGGDSTLIEPLITAIAKRTRASPERLRVYVIIGRDTFSSALLNAYSLKNQTHAVIVGEASGGKPNSYGEVQYLTLRRTRLRVRYSTKYYELVEDDALPSMIPDWPCTVTFTDYLSGHDPCLSAILGR